jgi:hypothetical protein
LLSLGKVDRRRRGTDALSERRPSAPEVWRGKLDEVDKAAVVAWVHKWGMEGTARIIAELAGDNGRSRPLQEWQILSLLKLAHLSLQAPDRALGAIAQEVAKAAMQPRIRKIPVEKLESELESHFREKQRIWRLFARPGLLPSVTEIADRLGLERVARIVAVLTETSGKRGRLEEMETLLLVSIAHVMRRQPDRTLHDVAVEVAKNAPQVRNRNIDSNSLLSQLQRDYRRTRHTWTLLTDRTPPPQVEAIARASRRRRSFGERRALARIVQLMPTALDFYDMLIAEIRATEKNNARQLRTKIAEIKLARRERVEKWSIEAMERQRTSSWVKRPDGGMKLARGFYDMIEWDLRQFLGKRRKTPLTRRVGRKPAK